jgi:hypothetical protein
VSAKQVLSAAERFVLGESWGLLVDLIDEPL